jgi:hypothetical protein
VFNELYERYFTWWRDALQEPKFFNVAVDWHLYDWQEPYTKEVKERHVADARAWGGLIDMYSVQHPVLIGEWSMSTGTFQQVGQPFVEACTTAFQRASVGWYLWNWKIQRENMFINDQVLKYDEWDVQLQLNKADGLRPLK